MVQHQLIVPSAAKPCLRIKEYQGQSLRHGIKDADSWSAKLEGSGGANEA